MTDVSSYDSLPPTFVPVAKILFIDLLNPAYEVDISTTPHATIKSVIAEKIEGLAWGPDLPNGNRVLYVISDNDLNTSFPTQIYVFEIEPSASAANIDFVRQNAPGPLFPPGQVKQIPSGKKD